MNKQEKQGQGINTPKPAWKSKKGLVIGAICTAVLVLAVFVGLAVSGLSGEPPDDTSGEGEQSSSRDNVVKGKGSWTDNILMREEFALVPNPEVENDATLLGSDIQRARIKTVAFLDTLDGMPEDAWDVSAQGNKKVMAWVELRDDGFYDLYIGGNGGVAANEDSRYLFLHYTYVEEIRMNGNFHTENATDMCWMFRGCKNLRSVDVSGFDTSKVTDMSSMFFDCESLTSLDVSSFDTSSAKDMSGMFEYCESLTSLDVNNFDTSNVRNMSEMFSSCESLTSLDVSGFDTSNVGDMSWMFHGCKSLTSIDISGFDTSNVLGAYKIFDGCESLTDLDLSMFTPEQLDGSLLWDG